MPVRVRKPPGKDGSVQTLLLTINQWTKRLSIQGRFLFSIVDCIFIVCSSHLVISESGHFSC
jgi:hypothetical protein